MIQRKYFIAITVLILLAAGAWGFWADVWLLNKCNKSDTKTTKYCRLATTGISLFVVLTLLGAALGILCLRLKKPSQNVKVTLMFALIVFLLTTVAMTSILLFLQRKTIIEFPKYIYRQHLKAYPKNRQFVDFIQTVCECCGYKSYLVFQPLIPDSCCPDPKCIPANSYKQGCAAGIEAFVDRFKLLFLLGAPSFGVITFSVLFFIIFCNNP